MRTKNKKWTVPILAVLALATIISAGLYLAGGVQNAEAQSTCSVEHDASADTADQQCTSGVSPFTLTVENGATTSMTVYAYVSGGSDNAAVTLPTQIT